MTQKRSNAYDDPRRRHLSFPFFLSSWFVSDFLLIGIDDDAAAASIVAIIMIVRCIRGHKNAHV